MWQAVTVYRNEFAFTSGSQPLLGLLGLAAFVPLVVCARTNAYRTAITHQLEAQQHERVAAPEYCCL